jgi:hypothetical protein
MVPENHQLLVAEIRNQAFAFVEIERDAFVTGTELVVDGASRSFDCPRPLRPSAGEDGPIRGDRYEPDPEKRTGRISPLLEGSPLIQRLARLDAGGARLWVKRDGLMRVGGGGNKLRKLEFLIGETIAQGCDTFITTGGLQSNHAAERGSGGVCRARLRMDADRHRAAL